MDGHVPMPTRNGRPCCFPVSHFHATEESSVQILPGIEVKKVVFMRVCFCMAAGIHARRVNTYLDLAAEALFSYICLVIRKFRFWMTLRIRSFWSFDMLKRRFSNAGFHCNANDNYPGGPSQTPSLWIRSQKKQLDSEKLIQQEDDEGSSWIQNTAFLDDLLDTEWCTITKHVCLSVFAVLDLKWFVSLDRILKCRLPPLASSHRRWAQTVLSVECKELESGTFATESE